MKLLCIDPGPKTSGMVEMIDNRVVDARPEIDNEKLLSAVHAFDEHTMLIEMIACYGMPVGAETFETCVWIGRFIERFPGKWQYVFRRDVKLTLCDSMRAKDANVRQAILDRYPAVGGGKTPQIGTKKEPGPLFGVSKHAWSALAIGLTYLENTK